MTAYFLHTGLHKTGTKFFQHKVFPNLPPEHFDYNPTRLCQLISDLMKADLEDLDSVLKAIGEEKKSIELLGRKNVLISREIMSGDLFSFYTGYQERYERLYKAFPDATIICSLRYQVDWIISCYRETVHEHHYQSIEEFLGFKNGASDFVKADFRDLDLTGIVETLLSLFGPRNVNFYFYEDFKKDKNSMVKSLSANLGLADIDIIEDGDSVPNRGYSAFAIKLSILRFRILRFLNLHHALIHRPIRFFGPNSIPAGFENISVLPHEKYWHSGFLRDNEEVRSSNYPNNLGVMERLRLKFSWRNIIKNGIDKLTYRDWDMLQDYRQEMDLYFKERNRVLAERFEPVLGKLPEKYVR